MEIVKAKITDLKEFKGNPRKGNVKALAESLEANGQYRPIIVQAGTNQILAGNHLWKAAQTLGHTHIDAVYLEVDDIQAKKIVAADNRLADLGEYDEKLLFDLLDDIDLSGTGYEPADIDDLLASLDEQSVPPTWQTGINENTHQENVQQRPTLADRASHYAERTIRLLMCEYPNHQYVWIQERLVELREKYKIDNNAEAILKAVEEITGQECPND